MSRVLLPLLIYLSAAQAIFTGGFDIWKIPGNVTWVREVATTLNLPNAPNVPGTDGAMSMWLGMITTTGDFIQALAMSNAPENNNHVQGCQMLKTNEWCAVSSTLKSNAQWQTMAKSGAVAPPGSNMTCTYVYNDKTQQYDQTTYVNGQKVSFLSTFSGHGMTMTANSECTSSQCGTFPAFSWYNTKITLNAAVPTYGRGLMLVPGASGHFSTNDGGKTWVAPRVSIPQHTLPQQQGQASVPAP